MTFKKLVILVLNSYLLLGCGLLYKNKTPERIQIVIDSNAVVNYDIPINYKVIAELSNKKSWNITNHDAVQKTIQGAALDGNKILPDNYPNHFNDTLIKVICSFTKDDLLLQDSITLPYNYKSDVQVNFSGLAGKDGKKGTTGSLNFLTRDGASGNKGENGENGQNGHNLSIHVWKQQQFYFVRLEDLDTKNIHFYKAGETNFKFIVNVSGGNGGDGGQGGKGKNGKDEEIKNGKSKEAGKGGNGGNGGNGGHGGNPGNVYVYIHPTAIGFEKRISIQQKVGHGGAPGKGSEGGEGGKILESGNKNTKGLSGFDGEEGLAGKQNNTINMEVFNFNPLNW